MYTTQFTLYNVYILIQYTMYILYNIDVCITAQFCTLPHSLTHSLTPSVQEGEAPLTDWEKFAAREYEELIADEELNKQYEYEDDFEEEEEETPLGSAAKSAVEAYGM